MRRALCLGSLLALPLLSAACFESSQSALRADADVDSDVDTDTDTDTDTTPLDLTERLGPGEARAGRITKTAELIGGLEPKGRINDLMLYNSRIRVIVEDARPSDGWGVFGGTVADADIVRPEGQSGKSNFGDYFWGFNLRLLDPTEVTVVNDGTNGEPARVRTTGTDASLPFLDAMLGDVFPSEPLEETIVVDYVLAPDSDVLEIHTTIERTGAGTLDLSLAFHAFFLGDGLQYFMSGSGFDSDSLAGGNASILVAAGDAVSYGFFLDEDEITPIFNYSGMLFLQSNGARVRSGRSKTFTSYLVVSEGGVDPVLRAHDAWLGTTDLGTISGSVLAADGSTPVPGARVHVMSGADPNDPDSIYWDQAIADAEGHFEVQRPAGTYHLYPYTDGHALPPGQPVTIKAGQNITRDLQQLPPVRVNYVVSDPSGKPLPCKMTFDRQEGQVAPPASFGENRAPSGYQAWIHSHTGMGTVDLPAGSYIVTASRGFEYEIDQQLVILNVGEDPTLSFELERSVDTTGFVSCDFHIHSQASPDSNVLYQDRAASAVSEGLEIPLASDHDFIADWGPAAEAMGLSDWVQPIVGQEITTYTYGHFQAWPVDKVPDAPNDGAFSWYGKSAPELFAEVADYHTRPILMLNHPRSPSIGGYFSSVQFDRETYTFGREDNWSTQFDAIEIINGKGVGSATNETLPDWYAFLNHGLRFTGASGSDTHSLSNEVGSVRNWVASDTDRPPDVDVHDLRDTMRAMNTMASTGPFVTASVEGAGLGSDLTVDSGTVKLAVRVQAPTWMDVHTLEVVANGIEVEELTLDENMADPDNSVVRFDDLLEFLPERDTWYVVIVRGTRSMSPVSRGATPFAFTNPIFVDRDGNGTFEPLHQ